MQGTLDFKLLFGCDYIHVIKWLKSAFKQRMNKTVLQIY